MHIKVLRIQNRLWYHMSFHIWILFHIFLITKLGVASRMYTTTDSKSIQSTLTHIYTKSKISCAVHCSSSKVCRAASYDSVTHACVLDNGTTCRIQTESSTSAVFMTTLLQPDLAWKTLGGHIYCCGSNARTWDDAENDCQRDGGHLVKIEDEGKQACLEQVLLEENAIEETWIGATDVEKEGQWVWISDRTVLTYHHWYYYEPNNNGGNKHCAVLGEPRAFEWFDQPCFEVYHYICEK